MFTLIGDLVGSRHLPDRAGAQRLLAAVLAEVNEHLDPAQPLEPTVGDEVQGGFATLAEVTQATLLIRLGCLPTVDVRFGLGDGAVEIHDPDRRPLLQDGPGWWAAREAIETLAAPRRSTARTWFCAAEQPETPAGSPPTADPQRTPPPGTVNAYLLCRDQLVDRLPDRGRRMLRAALLGATQRAIADQEGISPSAVSQQFARGIGAVRDAQALLR